MKTRNDFVTNSSSSSFIMAFKREDESSEDRKYACLANRVIDTILNADRHYETYVADVFMRIKDFKEYLKSNYVYSEQTLDEAIQEDGWLREVHSDGIKYLNEGYTVAMKEVGYGDSTLKDMIDCIASCSDNFIIIDSYN